MKFLTVDPGEDTGWSVWRGDELLDAGTTKMWEFSDAVWTAATLVSCKPYGQAIAGYVEGDDELVDLLVGKATHDPIELVITENWSLYPWVVSTGALDWDECRTARLIGSLYAVCRWTGWRYEQQPAKIKERAVAAGAEMHFFHPLRENRHQNDAIMHGVYWNAKEAAAPWTDLSTTEWVDND